MANSALLLTSSGQEWHIHMMLLKHAKVVPEWQFHIATMMAHSGQV